MGLPRQLRNIPYQRLLLRRPRKWVPVNLHESWWLYRELIAAFTMRDAQFRTNRPGLGLHGRSSSHPDDGHIHDLFRGLAKIPSNGVPYPLVKFAALLPWTLFAEGLTRSTNTMVTNSTIMTKGWVPHA